MFIVDPYRFVILQILKGPFANIISSYFSHSLTFVILDTQGYLMKWRLAEGYSESNEAHYKMDHHTVLQCPG